MLVKVPCNCLTLDPGPIWITFQRIKADPGWSVWFSDLVADTMTPKPKLIPDQLFCERFYGFWGWMCMSLLGLCHLLSFAWPHRSTPYVQLSVSHLPPNSDDSGLRTPVCRNPPSPLCFACVWINRCLQERGERASGVYVFLSVRSHTVSVCVCR